MVTPRRGALIVVIDGLHTGFLGPYGAGWPPTPHWNALAAESLLVEFPTLDCLDQGLVYRGFLRGGHATSPADRLGPSLTESCRQAGIPCVAVTDVMDDPLLHYWRTFDELESLPIPHEVSPGEDLERTHAAHLFALAAERLLQMNPPFLLWVHLSTLAYHWDAPLAVREALADEDDPAPYPGTTPVAKELDQDADPDEVYSAVLGYAAQVVAIDAALETLLEVSSQVESQYELLTLVTSSRGYALGEHQSLGLQAEQLHAESVHVPFFLRTPSRRLRGQRWLRQIQPSGVFTTLAEWFEMPYPKYAVNISGLLAPADLLPRAERSLAISHSTISLRTPAWYGIAPRAPDGLWPAAVDRAANGVRLYAKPDDRWEVNPIQDRCPEIVDGMLHEMRVFLEAAESCQSTPLPELPRPLWQPDR